MHLRVTPDERLSAPTYGTAHDVMAGSQTAPIEMIGWTALRAALIAPGLLLVGVRGERVIWGSLAGATFVSLFALWRTRMTLRQLAQEAAAVAAPAMLPPPPPPPLPEPDPDERPVAAT